jgi:hypothetical protein
MKSKTTGDLTVYQISDGTLSDDTSYKWRVRYKCDYDVWSEWSDVTTFTKLLQGADRGLFVGGGVGASEINTIDYVSISATGNASDFGDLTVETRDAAATSNGTNDRGVNGGGYTTVNRHNVISYVTISSPGDASDFGDITVARYRLSATSNGTDDRGVFGGGYTTSYQEVIDYITISSAGDATDFGDLTYAISQLAATSNYTNDRGVFAGGKRSNTYSTNIISYITITNTGNATDFGDLSYDDSGRWNLAATSNGTNDRGLFAGGYHRDSGGASNQNVIDYITITSTGNSTNFGDLSYRGNQATGTSNMTDERAIFSGYDGNVIDYVTINSPGNASDFGDLSVDRDYMTATSNS